MAFECMGLEGKGCRHIAALSASAYVFFPLSGGKKINGKGMGKEMGKGMEGEKGRGEEPPMLWLPCCGEKNASGYFLPFLAAFSTIFMALMMASSFFFLDAVFALMHSMPQAHPLWQMECVLQLEQVRQLRPHALL